MIELILCIQLLTNRIECKELKEIEYKQITTQELVAEYLQLENELKEVGLDKEEAGLMTNEEFAKGLFELEKLKGEYLQTLEDIFEIVKENIKIQKIINKE